MMTMPSVARASAPAPLARANGRAPSAVEIVVGVLLYGALLFGHQAVIGVSPLLP